MFVQQQPEMSDLFEQLGLDSSDEAIENFIEKHKGLNKSRHLEEAQFWSESQAAFIAQSLKEDAAWAEVIDQLNARLHDK